MWRSFATEPRDIQKPLVVCSVDMSMPSFTEFLKSAVVKAGETARLQCTVDCQPTPAKITWCVPLSDCLTAYGQFFAARRSALARHLLW